QLPSRLPTIYSDPFALKIIMDNLVENAIKFTSGEGKVIIKAEKKEEKVRIEVEDMGIGIPDGEEKKIFEPFYRVDREEARKGWGSGLGLSITARLVELLGGKITAKNKKEGGSIFTLYLPLEVKNGKNNGGR
ncbi:ATP-binding protein, partial [Candidatus Calescamantes bacterium]|nr:ATP-binding protein [Candidatus Calescamantes bacterium]